MTTTENIRQTSRRSPAEIEREIQARRERVEELVSALEGRLSPGELMHRAIGYGRDGGREFATNLSHTVRANPMPTLLTAVGMAWLYAERDRPVSRDSIQGMHDDDSAGIGDRLSGTWDTTRDKAGNAKDFTRRQAHRVSGGFHSMLDDNPVALGALGVAAGALLGAIIPSTDSEDRWMGDMRDRVADRMRDSAHDVTTPPRSDGRSDPSTPMH